MRISNGTIHINGSGIVIGNGSSVSVVQSNGRTVVNGKDVTDLIVDELQGGVLQIVIEEGVLCSLQSDVAVEAKNVSGNIKAGNGIKCGDVGGDVRAGNSVNCGNVKGSVRAGNSVNHR